jgi:hypothetical protein
MARVGRLAGAILAETEGAYYLIGNPKEPCDFARAGFEPPVAIDAVARPFVRLGRCGPIETIALGATVLRVELEGEALARALADRFLIARNGSVSERLWRLVIDPSGESDGDGEEIAAEIDARWLGQIPAPVWRVVRDTVLKCT